MTDITALGELLIDFTQCGISENGRRLFEQNPGGAVSNVLAAAAKLGKTTAFIGKVGDDMHGRFLRDTLVECGVDVSGLVISPDVFTTLAFVSLNNGERSFSFARKPGADTCLRSDELNEKQLKNTRIFHIGSLSMTDEPVRSATFAAIKLAKASGALISYDPNYRASLWKSEEEAKDQMRSLIPYVDLMKLSDEEASLLTDVEDQCEAVRLLCRKGIKCVCMTLGKDGAYVGIGEKCVKAEPFPVEKVIDTTGAGDAFWGGFLSAFLSLGIDPGDIELEQAAECAKWGNATASLCTQRRGALCMMPDKREVESLLKTRK